MIVKVAIGMASLANIAEKACKLYRRDLAQAVGMIDVEYVEVSMERCCPGACNGDFNE